VDYFTSDAEPSQDANRRQGDGHRMDVDRFPTGGRLSGLAEQGGSVRGSEFNGNGHADGNPLAHLGHSPLERPANGVECFGGERRIPTCPCAAKEVLQELLDRLTHLKWSEDELFAVHLAVEEALMNALKHGNCLDASKYVHMVTELSERQVRIQITDEGSGFDPEDVPDPTLDENLEVPSGRGLMLMRAFMTRVEFNERGNQVTMEKLRSPSATVQN
jgi:serine/threonine-protein kinase RsbW